MVQEEVGYRISDSPSDNPTIKKSDNPLPVRALSLHEQEERKKKKVGTRIHRIHSVN